MKPLFLNRKVIIATIIANAIIIFIGLFPASPSWVSHADSIFTLFFLIELIFKLNESGFRKFMSDGWNRFDFIVILTSSIALLQYTGIPVVKSLGFISIFRIFRIFKLFLLFQFVPNISGIVNGSIRAIKASTVVGIAFSLILFIISNLSCAIYKNISPEYFATPLESMYSIFRLFSIEGWYEIPDSIAANVGTMAAFCTKIYFIFLLFSGGILGLSLINSIFVDTMVSDNNIDLEQKIADLTKDVSELTKLIKNQQHGLQRPN